MNKLTVASIAAALLAIAPAATAQNDTYVSAGYSIFSDSDVSLGGITGRVGTTFSNNFGVEGEISLGTQGETVLGVDIDLTNQYAVFGTYSFDASEQFSVIGRLGYSWMDFRGSTVVGAANVSVDGFAAGVGAQYQATDNLAFRADYTRFEADSSIVDGGLNTFTISAVLTLNAE